ERAGGTAKAVPYVRSRTRVPPPTPIRAPVLHRYIPRYVTHPFRGAYRCLQIPPRKHHVARGRAGGPAGQHHGDVPPLQLPTGEKRHRLEIVERRDPGDRLRRIPDAREVIDEERGEGRDGDAAARRGTALHARRNGERQPAPAERDRAEQNRERSNR